MEAGTFEIDINGYLLEANKQSLPKHPGIYFVYEATFEKEKDTVSIQQLIYIGEAKQLHERIINHEKYENWKKHVGEGNTLCYSTGRVPRALRERVKAAYIFKHKPPENDEYVDNFPFDQTTIKSFGNTARLNTDFTVNRI